MIGTSVMKDLKEEIRTQKTFQAKFKELTLANLYFLKKIRFLDKTGKALSVKVCKLTIQVNNFY